jgi:hypothetical protein
VTDNEEKSIAGHDEVGDTMQQVRKRKERMEQTGRDINSRHYYEVGRWRCSVAPSGAHHWLLDDSGWGQCKYCSEERHFAELPFDHPTNASHYERSQDSLAEGPLRQLLATIYRKVG